MSGSHAWYAVQSHPRRERFAHDRIAELGLEAFLPLVSERRPGARRSSIVPLFPGYLFARLSADDGDVPRVRWLRWRRLTVGEAINRHAN